MNGTCAPCGVPTTKRCLPPSTALRWFLTEEAYFALMSFALMSFTLMSFTLMSFALMSFAQMSLRANVTQPLSITTFRMITLIIRSFYVTLSISDSQHKRHSA